MSEEITLKYTVDTTEVDKAEAKVVRLNEQTNDMVKKSGETLRKVKQTVLGAVHMVESFIEMAGASLSATTKAIVNAITGIGTMLLSLASADAITPGAQALAAIAIIQYSTTIAQAAMAEATGRSSENTIGQLLGDIRMFAGGFAF